MLGEYPCCDGPLMIAVPDVDLPKFKPDTCEHCGAKIWHKFSRLDPVTWTEEDFLQEYDVNEETKKITPK